MGKGGEQNAEKEVRAAAHSASFEKKRARLNSLQTEELRKWATAYGVKSADDRDALLNELVCLILYLSTAFGLIFLF
jgi:hypothetical protein